MSPIVDCVGGAGVGVAGRRWRPGGWRVVLVVRGGQVRHGGGGQRVEGHGRDGRRGHLAAARMVPVPSAEQGFVLLRRRLAAALLLLERRLSPRLLVLREKTKILINWIKL